MKKLVTLMALSWTMLASAQTADQFIVTGTNDLALDNLWGADTNFTSALAVSPTNKTANLLKAATRLLVLPQTPAGSNFLVSLGFPKTNRWLPHVAEASLPNDAKNYPIFPANYNSTNITYFFRTNIMVAIDASLTNLANITNTGYTLFLPSFVTSFTLSPDKIFTEDVTLDYGDIQMLRALLSAIQFWGYTINANNYSVVIPQLESWMETKDFTFQSALAAYPNFLALQNTSDLAASEGALTNAIANYFTASAFIRNRPANATNRLFELDPSNAAEEAQFRTTLTNILLSLKGPVELSPSNANAVASTANIGAYFAGTHSLRSLMPHFNGDSYVNDSLPDYTFGGIVPDWPAYKTEKTLRKEFYSYTGMYAGLVYDINYDDPRAGVFGVLVNTNGQATVVGYDTESFQNYDGQAGGVSAQFNVGTHGDWQFNSNSLAGVSGYGSIGKDGTFWGELDFTNGDSVQLNGSQQWPLGSFQNAAGGYSGTWSGNFGGQPQSGTLLAGIDADGYIIFCVFNNGTENDGGFGLFNSNNYFFTTDTASGTTVFGTLDTNSLQITGISSNPYGIANWNLNRTANIPFDVPPFITRDLPLSTNAAPGTNVTFSLTAAGSPPLCYQWYFNGIAIPFATANTLVVSNVQSGSVGIYSISVNNAVGETNAGATLNVTMPDRPVLNFAGFMAGGKFQFQINGVAGQNYTLLMSTNLASTNWMPILVTNAPADTFDIMDPNATNIGRFYRIKRGL